MLAEVVNSSVLTSWCDDLQGVFEKRLGMVKARPCLCNKLEKARMWPSVAFVLDPLMTPNTLSDNVHIDMGFVGRPRFVNKLES